MAFADEGRGDRALVDPDLGHRAAGALRGEFGGGQRAGGDGGPGQPPHGQSGGQHRVRAVEGDPVQQRGRSAERGPGVGGGPVDA